MKSKLIWVFIFILGIFLRLYHIKTNGLWNDEIFTLSIVNLNWSDFISFFLEGKDFHPPLHYLLLKSAKFLSFGYLTEEGLRIINLTPYVISAVALYKFSINNLSFRFSSLITFAIMSLAPNFVYVTAELRQYGLLLLFTVLFIIVLEKILTHTQKKMTVSIQLGILSLALSLTQYVGICIVASFYFSTMILILKRKEFNRIKDFVPAISIYVFGMLLYSPILVKHLSKTVPYTKTIIDTFHFLYLSYGYFIFLYIFGALLVLIKVLRRQSSRSHLHLQKKTLFFREENSIHFSAILVITFITFLMIVIGFYIVTGTNILTLGIVIILVFLLSLALSTIFTLERDIYLIAGIAIFTAILTFSVISTPSNFDSNRVSTVDETIKVSELIDESNSIIIHVDWEITNEYYAEKMKAILPNTLIDKFDMTNREKLSKEIKQILEESNNEQVYLISRIAESLVNNSKEEISFYEVSPYIYLVNSE